MYLLTLETIAMDVITCRDVRANSDRLPVRIKIMSKSSAIEKKSRMRKIDQHRKVKNI